jgi:hypothetical protein
VSALVAFILPVMFVFMMFGAVFVVAAIKDAVAEERARRRVAAAVMVATARLRRVEQNAMRKMHDMTSAIFDVDGEEA